MAQEKKRQKTVIIGAGPVGALAALYAAQRGQEVEVYELRGDLRLPTTTPLNFTKSINLALSERGINALKQSGAANSEGPSDSADSNASSDSSESWDSGETSESGDSGLPELVEKIFKETIPMRGRMIHGKGKDGELYEQAQDYDIHGRTLYAVDRGDLNAILLDELENLPNVKLSFNHKLTGADFNKQKAWLEVTTSSLTESPTGRHQEIEIDFDLLIGADGAHSAARYHMMKYVRMDYKQEYIDTLWCEFTISKTTIDAGPPESRFRISPNHLHIWPGQDFMFIAIPSFEGSFTCTLFMPSAPFAQLSENPEYLPEFFSTHFPGIVDILIPASDLIASFKNNPHLPLISITCTPYHYTSSAVILGDAAHAMVPFYGQGMNCGLEDVYTLFKILDAHSYSGKTNPFDPGPNTTYLPPAAREKALAKYSRIRTPDAHAISSLALENYIEMRSSVISPIYKGRKWLEEKISVWFPSLGWKTKYSRVSFGNERYSEIVKVTEWQGKVLGWVLAGVGSAVLVGFVSVGLRVARVWSAGGGRNVGVLAGLKRTLGR